MDPKKIWPFIQRKKGNTGISGLMLFKDEEIFNPQDTVNQFGKKLQ